MKSAFWMTDKEYRFVTEKTPIPCVDLVVLRKGKMVLDTLLFKRKTGYERGKWCLLGGRIRKNETIESAIGRHISDAGVKVSVIKPFSPNLPAWVHDKRQDKTKHPIVGVYPVKIISGTLKKEGKEFNGVGWFPVNKLPETGYDSCFEVLKIVEQLSLFSSKT